MKGIPSNTRALGFARAVEVLRSGPNHPVVGPVSHAQVIQHRDSAVSIARSAERLSIASSSAITQHAAPKCAGYDGEPPEWRDPKNRAEWEKKREEIPDFNANTDRLEWLLAHKLIDNCQHAAGEKLQKAWHLSDIGGYATPGNSPGSGGIKTALADVKLQAMEDYGEAMQAVFAWPCSKAQGLIFAGSPLGYRGEAVLFHIVLQGWSRTRLEKHWRIRHGSAMPLLHDALNALVVHYKLG